MYDRTPEGKLARRARELRDLLAWRPPAV
jgi:hypothetical protein